MARFERVALAAILVASGAGAAACDAIAGLGGFHDVPDEPDAAEGSADSSPFPIPDDASDASEDAGIDATLDADAAVDTGIDATDDGQGFTAPEAGPSVDYRWARWIMPNAASTWDAALPSYSALSGDGGVKDNVTGLEWGNMTAGVTSIASATTACAPPWRLPTRIELVSILDTSQTTSVLASAQFSTMQPVRYWTSSVTPAGEIVVVDFGGGTITASLSGQAVLCIYAGDSDGGGP